MLVGGSRRGAAKDAGLLEQAGMLPEESPVDPSSANSWRPRSAPAPGRRSWSVRCAIGALSCRRQISAPAASVQPRRPCRCRWRDRPCRRRRPAAPPPRRSTLLDVLGGELPEHACRRGVDRRCHAVGVDGEHPAVGDHGPRDDPRAAAAAGTDVGAPGDGDGSAASRCSIAWVALPPDCGQAALRTGGGSATLSSARRGSARSSSSIRRTDLRSPGSGGAEFSPSQVPSPQPASRPATAPVSTVRRGAALTSWPERRFRRSPAAAPPRGAAATAATPTSRLSSPSRLRALSSSPARIAASASSSRAWCRQGASPAASGSSVFVSSAGSAVSSRRSAASSVARSRSIGSSPVVVASCVECGQGSGLVLLAELGFRFLSRASAAKPVLPSAASAANCSAASAPWPAASARSAAAKRSASAARSRWLPLVPADLGRGADHDQHGDAEHDRRRSGAKAREPVAPQLLVDLADELFRFHA